MSCLSPRLGARFLANCRAVWRTPPQRMFAALTLPAMSSRISRPRPHGPAIIARCRRDLHAFAATTMSPRPSFFWYSRLAILYSFMTGMTCSTPCACSGSGGASSLVADDADSAVLSGDVRVSIRARGCGRERGRSRAGWRCRRTMIIGGVSRRMSVDVDRNVLPITARQPRAYLMSRWGFRPRYGFFCPSVDSSTRSCVPLSLQPPCLRGSALRFIRGYGRRNRAWGDA